MPEELVLSSEQHLTLEQRWLLLLDQSVWPDASHEVSDIHKVIIHLTLFGKSVQTTFHLPNRASTNCQAALDAQAVCSRSGALLVNGRIDRRSSWNTQ